VPAALAARRPVIPAQAGIHFRQFVAVSEGSSPGASQPAPMRYAAPMNPVYDFVCRQYDRFDAWSRSRLTPEELAEADTLSRQLGRHIWRWTAALVVIVTLISLVLHLTWPMVGLGNHVFIAIVCLLWLAAILLPAWFGYRRFGVYRWRWTATAVLLSVAGGVMGYAVGAIMSGKTWAEIPMGEVPKTIALAVLVGISVSIVTTTISRVRIREAYRRSERLAAENERERAARRAIQAELKLLQAQVEPHFLFNTLANVRHLVQSGSPESLRMLDHLIHYLRTALPDIRSDSTTLGKEVELARAYLEIMRMRMGGELTFSIDVGPELEVHAFPPLMLMTLVENAMKHGIAPKGRGEVRIAVRRHGDLIEAEVIDDGRGLGGTLGQGIGLANVRERLRALHGERAKFVLESNAAGGTVARLEIPA
jgi:signal transduction histidine kinase